LGREILDGLRILSIENYITARINFDEVIDAFAEKMTGKYFFFLNFEDFLISTFEYLLFNLILEKFFFEDSVKKYLHSNIVLFTSSDW
jgi:hypothetical protein